MRHVFTLCLLLCSSRVALANDLVCGERGSPEFAGAMVTIHFAQGLAENIARAKCAAGDQEFCSAESQKQYGIQGIFNAIKNFPSLEENSLCAAIRSECQIRCEQTNLFSTNECTEGCFSTR